MARLSLEDLADAAELDLGTTEWVIVAQAQIDAFAEVTEGHAVNSRRRAAGNAGTSRGRSLRS